MPRNSLITDYIEKEGLDESAREVISSFFKYVKVNIGSHIPYTIRMKNLGVLKNALIKVKRNEKRLETFASKRELTVKEKEKLFYLKEYLKKYGSFKEVKGE